MAGTQFTNSVQIYKTLLNKSENLRATVLKVAILGSHIHFHSNQCNFLIRGEQHHYSSNPGSESLAHDSPVRSASLSALTPHYSPQNEVQPPSEAGAQQLNLRIKELQERFCTQTILQNKTNGKKKGKYPS